MKKLLLCLSLIGLQSAYCQIKDEIFESFKLNERREVSYYFPEEYSEEKKYPVILVLNAELLFDQVVATSKFYSSRGLMPESIIVGVYQGNEELTWEDCGYNEESGLPHTKGAKFYEFLGMELIPMIGSKYSTAPFKMIIGYDVSANFANYFLFKDHSIFNAYLLFSPALAADMENRIPSRLLALNQELFYNVVIEQEKSSYRNAHLQLDKSIASLSQENLHYKFDEYPAADHTTIIPFGMGKAFNNVFKMYAPITPKEYQEELLPSNEPTISYLEKKYELIHKLFGFEKPIELNDIMAIYAASLKKEDFKSLESLAEVSKKSFPKTMLGFYLEGEYLEKIGEPKKAMKAFEKAFIMEEIDFLTKDMALEKMNDIKADFGY